MLPLRLTFLLIGAVILALISFGNPEPVPVRLLFWTAEIELYKVILVSVVFGIIMAILYIGHIRYIRRGLDRFRR